MVRSRPEATSMTGQPSRRADGVLRLELAAVVIVSIAVVLVAVLHAPSSSSVPTADPLAASTAMTSASEPLAVAQSQQSEQDSSIESPASAADQPESAEQPHMPEMITTVDRPAATGQGDIVIPGRLDRYQVQRGETLQSISADHSVSVDDIVVWNDHLDIDTVLIRGEWLWIPRAEPSLVADEDIDAEVEESHGRGGG